MPVHFKIAGPMSVHGQSGLTSRIATDRVLEIVHAIDLKAATCVAPKRNAPAGYGVVEKLHLNPLAGPFANIARDLLDAKTVPTKPGAGTQSK